MPEDIKQNILTIITYSSDEGTSGYLLSSEQIEKLFALFEQYANQARIDELENFTYAGA